MPKINYLLITTSSICFIIFLLHLIIVKNAVYGDGRYYYSTVRSLVIDGNLDYSNEYQYFGIKESKTITGYLANKYAIGAPIIWLPAFFITHLFLQGNGFSLPYQIITGLTTIILTTIGLYFLYKTIRNYFPSKTSLFTILIILFGTNLFYYASIDTINSHGISFALTSIYFYFLLKKGVIKNWFLLGLILGLAGLIRNQDLILCTPTIIMLFSQTKIINILRKLKALISFILGTTISFSLQIYLWFVIYGTFYKSPYLSKTEGFSFLKPQILGVLFNKNTGLVIWTPIVALGIIAFFFFKNKIKNLIIITYFIEFYLVASWSSWDQGAAFGTRMLISVLPILAFGIAQIINKLSKIKYILIFLSYSIFVNFSLTLIYLITH